MLDFLSQITTLMNQELPFFSFSFNYYHINEAEEENRAGLSFYSFTVLWNFVL